LASGCLVVLIFTACAHLQPAQDETLEVSTTVQCDQVTTAPRRLRVASYNIKSATMQSLEEIAHVLATLDADVVALQEVDRHLPRSGGRDEAQWLAQALGYNHAFAGALKRDGGAYGVALLSRLPIAAAERLALLSPASTEPRVALHVTLCAGARPFHVVASHTDVLPWSALENINTLADHLRPLVGKGLLLLADLNSLPGWPGPRVLTGLGLADLIGLHAEGTTFVGDPLGRRLDYIFSDAPFTRRFSSAGIHPHTASDHLPVFADLDVTAGL